jgi:hypothetical protein
MVSYGLGTRGDLVVDSDTTLDGQMLQFDDLFVTAGNTLTVPHRTVLMVRDSLEVNGEIVVEKPGNQPYSTLSGVTNAGSGGGSINIIAFSIIGTGRVVAPGGNGDTESIDDSDNGTPASVAHETVSATPATNSEPGSSIIADFDTVLENRLTARPRVSKTPWQHMTAGSGALANTDNSNSACGGGLGGGGGSRGSGTASGGGGGGGFVFVATQNENQSVTYAAPGGDSGGGGGGGGGGIIVGYTDTNTFQHEAPAGSGGAGNAGDGFAIRLPIENIQ